MNWDQVEANWKNVKGQLRQKWGKLTDDDLEQAKGRREQIVAAIQRRYGDKREAIEGQVDQAIAKLQ